MSKHGKQSPCSWLVDIDLQHRFNCIGRLVVSFRVDRVFCNQQQRIHVVGIDRQRHVDRFVGRFAVRRGVCFGLQVKDAWVRGVHRDGFPKGVRGHGKVTFGQCKFGGGDVSL